MSGLACDPFFLDSPRGRLFAVHHRPAPGLAVHGHVLCVPPFNEEQNRCRSMITLQAQALAARGWGTLLVDLHGTGDSAGDYVDARWDGWLDDVAVAARWLEAQPGGLRAIWGIRLGAILAGEWHAARADAALALLLWQPVADGKMHLTQFMRVKLAAQLDRPDLPKETTGSLRATLAQGQPVEIAGYEIHPALAQALDAASLGKHRLAAGTRVLWLEQAVSAETAEAASLTPATQALLARWPGAEVQLQAQTFTGPAFWQVYERVLAPAIIEQGTAWLCDEAG